MVNAVHCFDYEIRLTTCDIMIARSIRLSGLRAAHRHGVGLLARLITALDRPRDRWVVRVLNEERVVVLVIIAAGREADLDCRREAAADGFSSVLMVWPSLAGRTTRLHRLRQERTAKS
jgi:hypothetical protein